MRKLLKQYTIKSFICVLFIVGAVVICKYEKE